MAKTKLTAEQLEDSVRLRRFFKDWQAARRAKGLEWSQEEVAKLFGFGQSALSQYLGGTLALNPETLVKFSEVLGKPPQQISPSLVRQINQQTLQTLHRFHPEFGKVLEGYARLPAAEQTRIKAMIDAAQKGRTRDQ